MFVPQQFMLHFFITIGASFSYIMFSFSSLNKASMIHAHVCIIHTHIHECLEVALPNTHAEKKEKTRVKERLYVYIYQQKGEQIVTTILFRQTLYLAYRLIAHLYFDISFFFPVVWTRNEWEICYFWAVRIVTPGTGCYVTGNDSVAIAKKYARQHIS